MLPNPSYRQTGTKCTLQHRCSSRKSGPGAVYEISKDTLGVGAFGVVRKTWSRETGDPYVLKTVKKKTMNKVELVNLANEIAIHEMCDHPNIARIFESFEDLDLIHIAMEACEGGELYSYTKREGFLPEAQAKICAEQVLHALFYLHEVKHVAHRDVKQENLLLKYPGVPLDRNVVKLIDFGFAHSFSPGKRSLRLVAGTPVYMAPEIVRGPYTEKCDVWSTGVLLHELLVGRLPFQHANPHRLFHLAAAQPLNLEGPSWGTVSSAAKALLQGLLAKKPTKRASAKEALEFPWFQEAACAPGSSSGSSSAGLGSSELAGNLRAFGALSDFQKAALRLAAYRLDDAGVEDERSAFKLLDKNGDGQISLQELDEACPQLGLDSEEARGIFQQLDVDGSGAIEYSEFLSAAIPKDQLSRNACWEVFRFCDTDGSGSISPEEVQELVARCSSKASTCSTAASSDVEAREEMDFDRFVTLLRRPGSGGA